MSRKVATDVLKGFIRKDILNGVSFFDIVDRIENDKYGVGLTYSNKQSRNMYYYTRKALKEEWKEEEVGLREQLLERMLKVYNDCIRNNDRKNAISALKELAKISGNYETKEKVDMNINGNIEIDFGI